MKLKERQKFLAEQLEIIYAEYSNCVYRVLALKPFLNDLISTAKGKPPAFDLRDVSNKNNIE